MTDSGGFRPIVQLLSVLLILGSLTGCVTTGRGEFPVFPVSDRTNKTLAVLPPAGPHSKALTNSVLYHLNRTQLENTFESVRIIADKKVSRLLEENDTLGALSPEEARSLSKTFDADLLLGFVVHDLRIEQFSTTETERLERSETRYRNIDVDSSRKNSKDGSITSQESEYTVTEVPVSEDKIRVVLSMSAEVYDLEKNAVVWSGRRIERAEDDLKDLSAVELRDIAVERIMYRIISRLTG